MLRLAVDRQLARLKRRADVGHFACRPEAAGGGSPVWGRLASMTEHSHTFSNWPFAGVVNQASFFCEHVYTGSNLS
jgi:hypothetical protein